MRLEQYNSIDEVLSELLDVMINHYGITPLHWGYSKNEALKCIALQYIDTVIKIASSFKVTDSVNFDINPSQLAKTAYRFSVTSKLTPNVDRSIISSSFLHICNMSVEKRKEKVDGYLNLLSTFSFFSTNDISAKKINYLNALIRAYSELIFCDEHTISGEISGPYLHKDGQVIIRDFHLLNPIELHDFLSDFNLRKICTYCLYDTTDIKVDMFGNIPLGVSDSSGSLLGFYIEIEDKYGKKTVIDNIENIIYICNYLRQWIVIVSKKYKEYGKYYLWKSTVACEFYALKPFLDAINQSWNIIPDSVDEQMFCDMLVSGNNKKTEEAISEKMDEEYYKRLLHRVDPRIV